MIKGREEKLIEVKEECWRRRGNPCEYLWSLNVLYCSMYCTVLYYIILHIIILYSTEYCTALSTNAPGNFYLLALSKCRPEQFQYHTDSTVITLLYYTVLECNVLYCNVIYCIVINSTVLYCIVLFRMVYTMVTTLL